MEPAPPSRRVSIDGAIIFLLLPMVYTCFHTELRGSLGIVLWLLAGYTLFRSKRSPRGALPAPPTPTGPVARRMILRTGVLGAALAAWVYATAPADLCFLPRNEPALWLVLLLGYPLLSVLPQEIIYRHGLFEIYRMPFRNHTPPWAPRLLGGLLFGWAHLFFLSPFVLLTTTLAGILLCDTWIRTRSLRLVCLEHSLYGTLLFSLGTGSELAGGTLAMLRSWL